MSASRDVGRARDFARDTGVPRVHATYEALLTDPAVDAIYNPLPNSLHAEWSMRAAEAGKHVLCEKPLATSAAEARAMFDAARRNDVCLVEAEAFRDLVADGWDRWSGASPQESIDIAATLEAIAASARQRIAVDHPREDSGNER